MRITSLLLATKIFWRTVLILCCLIQRSLLGEENMHVLHINRNYISSPLHQTMIEHLDAFVSENIVFAPSEKNEVMRISPNKNVIVSRCFSKNDRYIFDLKQFKIIRSVRKSVDVGYFDIIHAYTLFTDGNCAMKLSRKYNVPYVVAIRNTDVNDFFRRLPFLRKRGIQIMEQASAIFFLSQSYQNEVMSRYVPKRLRDKFLKKSFLIPNGIDDFWIKNTVSHIDESHLERIKQNHINLIYAGRIDKNKNIATTIKALKMLCDKGWAVKLTVVGRVEDKEEFNNIVKSPFVEYHPACGKEQLIQLYRENDIFVMPSFTETFGLVYAEAMSQGLPVIYTKGQGFDGQFTEGEVGFHVDPIDKDDITEKVTSICKNYMTMSSNCYRTVKKYQWDLISRKYMHIYRGVLNDKMDIR